MVLLCGNVDGANNGEARTEWNVLEELNVVCLVGCQILYGQIITSPVNLEKI